MSEKYPAERRFADWLAFLRRERNNPASQATLAADRDHPGLLRGAFLAGYSAALADTGGRRPQ